MYSFTYSYTDSSTSYDDSTGIYTTTITSSVYDCGNNAFYQIISYEYVIDYCNSAQIPSAYTSYDSTSGIWSYSTTTSTTDNYGVTTVTTTTYLYECASQTVTTEVTVSYDIDYCNSYQIPSGYSVYSGDVYYYETVVTSENDDDSYTTTTTDYYYNCATQTYYQSSTVEVYYDPATSCDDIPSGFAYDSVTGLYKEIVTTSFYDDSLGGTYTVTSTWYYDCSAETYSETNTYAFTENYCAAVNIPSGYTYDSASGMYIEYSTSQSTSTTTGVTTTTVTTTYYDCNTLTYTTETTYSYSIDYCAYYNIPSGYYYDVNLGLYSYADLSTTFDDTTGIYTETLTVYYYDCNTNSYSE